LVDAHDAFGTIEPIVRDEIHAELAIQGPFSIDIVDGLRTSHSSSSSLDSGAIPTSNDRGAIPGSTLSESDGFDASCLLGMRPVCLTFGLCDATYDLVQEIRGTGLLNGVSR